MEDEEETFFEAIITQHEFSRGRQGIWWSVDAPLIEIKSKFHVLGERMN
jgi:hypothetical protein